MIVIDNEFQYTFPHMSDIPWVIKRPSRNIDSSLFKNKLKPFCLVNRIWRTQKIDFRGAKVWIYGRSNIGDHVFMNKKKVGVYSHISIIATSSSKYLL